MLIKRVNKQMMKGLNEEKKVLEGEEENVAPVAVVPEHAVE